MKRQWIVRPEAKDELATIAEWYDDRQPGLGDEFVDAVSEVYERIDIFPESAPRVREEIRHAVLKRFPYSVHYVVLDGDDRDPRDHAPQSPRADVAAVKRGARFPT